GRLVNPFWEDVVRLLPRSLGTIEKARSVLARLQELAADNVSQRGRLLGLAAASIIENRDLFPDVSFAEMADRMAALYSKEGAAWPLNDRLLFLDALGQLDPMLGDPRCGELRWVRAAAKQPELKTNCALGMWPVTVQEFRKFAESARFADDKVWRGLDEIWGSVEDRYLHRGHEASDEVSRDNLQARIRAQYRHPNRPIVGISLAAAVAYCRWLTAQRTDGQTVRLPGLDEWRAFAP